MVDSLLHSIIMCRIEPPSVRRPKGGKGPRKDPCSCANIDHATVTHMAIKWDVHFQLKMLVGSVALHVKLLKDTTKVFLDIRDLSIRSINVDGIDVEFRIAPNSYTFFGSKLCVYLPEDKSTAGTEIVMHISYTTSNEASALQWLKKEQTTDGKAPYLFSQCQAIHARSIVPCMDTPSVKQTYEAEVSVPSGLTCLMSSIGEGSKGDEERTTFFFKQPVAIPSYLLAIVVGLLEKRDISHRCAVWAEPSVVDKAHWEFSETEDILSCAESIVGPYIWGRYDMVCLPATFPFGGMENPCLTFLTPTLIAGDRSLVSVIAHEIAHSWSGNLVTNSSWEHFWLNEGFTMFIERKICGRLVSESYRQFMAFNGWTNNLIPAVHEQFHPTHPFTKLVQEHENVDPDVAFSCVPYEKGSSLLFSLEQRLGGSQVFELYLRDYISTFSHKAIDTYQWRDHLYSYFHDQKEILDSFDMNSWLFDVGMPPSKPKYDEEMVVDCDKLLKEWIDADETTVKDITKEMYVSMKPLQQIEFISQLWQHNPPIEHYKLDALDSLYALTNSENCEILLNWIRLCVKSRWEPIFPRALRFLNSQGRLKYCRPVYRDLSNWPFCAKEVRDNFLRTRHSMHPITAEMISKDLHLRHQTHTVCF
ncbi:hypothetical protein PFISCL1PPCAC_15680 [Pristionchus fissidentatus]|uniref:Peptidase M1 leukotriene A4 hydrolase/aminopeptidase C-terminal domain-containing protein n=1 Tax=Pristionchus fissidentatus TaxID=1538716 RepID=A0AAV5W117_9BILA|nr:hypothetical protein PFISCL1PPCAC_15680 [Pristionchus fissidentatus]